MDLFDIRHQASLFVFEQKSMLVALYYLCRRIPANSCE